MPHIHKLYDFTASAFIVFEDKVLLLHHKKLNTWLQPGGHIELDEDPEQTLWHEIKEETGLDKSNLEIIEPIKDRPLVPNSKTLPLPFDSNVFSYGDDPIHKHIDFCYLIRSNTDKISGNSESNDIRWFTKKELKDMKNKIWPDVYNRAIYCIDLLSAS